MSHFKEATRIFKILFYLFITHTLNSEALPLEMNSIRELESLVKCVVAAIKTENKPTVTIIEDDTKYTVYENVLIKESLTKFLSEEYMPQIVLHKLQILNETVNKFEGNIMLVVTFVHSCKIFEQLDVIVIDEKLKYLIIPYEYEDCNMDLEKIGWTLQHYDATFIFQSENHTIYKFQTTIPDIDESTCDYDAKVKLTIINTCFNGTLEKSVIFPAKKIKNLKGCPFHVGMATLYPYSIIENKESLQNLQPINESQIRGSDFEIIKNFCNNINASLNMYYIYREEENPYLHNDFISYLLNGSIDACAGGLYNIYGNSVSYSGIYNMQAVIWVYQVEREPRSWRTIAGKINGLYIFILFYICYSVIWILFCNFDRIIVSWKNTFLYSWGALIGAASLQDSTTLKQKILNLSYLLLCIYLSAYVSVQLYSFYTIQGPPETFKTNDEVMESGKTPYLNLETKFFVEDAKYIAFAKTSLNCSGFEDCENKTVSEKGSTVIIDGHFYSLQALTAVEDEARVLRASEAVLITYHEMVIRNDSPFVSKFQKVVVSLFEAGICDRLFLEEIGLLVHAKAKSANANIMANSYRCESGCAITIELIGIAIYVWIVGCTLSLIVFVVEIILNKEH